MTGSGPRRSSTAATGTAPRRGSRRLTTAAPRTRGWRSSAARTSSGRTLKPPRMMTWSARPRIQRKPSASMRARSVVRTHEPPAPSCAAFTSSSPSASAPSTRPSSGSTTRSSQPGCARPTLPRLAAQNCSVVGQVPAGDAAAELGRGVGAEHGDPVLGHERIGVVGRERRRPRDDRADAAQVRGVDVGLEHHPQRRGHEARRRRAMAANGVDPAVHREAFEQRERAAVGDALQDAEQTAEMDERRVDDRDAGAQAKLGVAIGLVVLRAGEHAPKRLVGEVDALGRTRRPARQHLHGDAAGASARCGRLRGAHHVDGADRRRERRASSTRPRGRRASRDPPARRRRRELERRDLVADPLGPALRVDRDDARAGAQRAEHEGDRRRVDCAAARRSACPRPEACAATDSTVAPSSPQVRQRPANSIAGAEGSMREHRGDALAELGGRASVISGSSEAAARAACRLTSAMPIGFPSARVDRGPAPSRRGTAGRATPRSRGPCPAWRRSACRDAGRDLVRARPQLLALDDLAHEPDPQRGLGGDALVVAATARCAASRRARSGA